MADQIPEKEEEQKAEGEAAANEPAFEESELEFAGGKLPGNHDDFDGELDEGPHPVPGADKKHHPAHAMSKGETKHLGL